MEFAHVDDYLRRHITQLLPSPCETGADCFDDCIASPSVFVLEDRQEHRLDTMMNDSHHAQESETKRRTLRSLINFSKESSRLSPARYMCSSQESW